jgi:hypothetical protein
MKQCQIEDQSHRMLKVISEKTGIKLKCLHEEALKLLFEKYKEFK